MIEAAIFDLDGLLVDSEPLWQQAEMEVFATVGLIVNAEQCMETQGYRIDEAVEYWYRQYPWEGVTITELAERVVIRLNQLLTERAQPMPGVVKTLDFFKQRNIPMVVASSSNLSIIENAVNGLGIAHYFQSLHSAQFEEYGKPHPAVFLKAAAAIGVAPVNCLVFEDSLFGLLAAKSAKMKAVSVPSHIDINNPKFSIADAILPTLDEWNEEVFNLVNKG
jgi:HAD superfamily hydrolase (TIGR01509 family)